MAHASMVNGIFNPARFELTRLKKVSADLSTTAN